MVDEHRSDARTGGQIVECLVDVLEFDPPGDQPVERKPAYFGALVEDRRKAGTGRDMLSALLELRVLLEELYSNVPGLTVDGEPIRLRSSFFNGVKSLPCTTGPAA